MGNQVSTTEAEEFLNRLTFCQIAEDEHFGGVEIFRSKEPPYEYIMNYRKTFLNRDSAYTGYLELMQNLKNKMHKNLARLHLVQQKEENHMCIKNIKLSCFFNYYNFTLSKVIERKKKTGSCFSEGEIWYVLVCLLEVGQFLKNNGISYGDYHSSTVFLTPEGYIKLYLTGLYPQNKHNAYYSALTSKQEMQKHLLSPQQLRGLLMTEYEPKFNLFKSDVFSITMLALQLLFLDDPKFYYSMELCEVNFGRINYQLATIKNQYSQELQQLLKKCLQADPERRLDFDEAVRQVNAARRKSNITVAGCIKFTEDDDEQSRKKKSTDVKKKTGEGLRNLPICVNQKLVPGSITIYADKKMESVKKGLSNSLETSAASSTFSNDRKSNKDSRF